MRVSRHRTGWDDRRRLTAQALGAVDPGLKAALLENLLRIVVRVTRRMTDEVAALAG